MFTSNVNQVITRLEKEHDRPAKILRRRLKVIIDFVHEGVTSRTPVHTGQSLRNWQWSKGTPASSVLGEKGSGSIVGTNNMALGSEPRRAENQPDVDASKDALNLNDPFDVFYLTNNHDSIMDLEYGRLPTSALSRSKAGMARITFKELKVFMRGM